MKISTDYFSESNGDVAEMLMATENEFSFAITGGDEPDDEEEEEEETEEEPALDPDIVHSPVTPQTGGKPE
jgi:hypothetical protein